VYIERLVTLEEVWQNRRTKQKSINALRERAKEGILWYVDSRGAAWIFDLDLSLVRENASSKCKRPGTTWKRISVAMKALDKENLNKDIIKILNGGPSTHQAAVKFVLERLVDEIG
jgi:hypothetical protein